jgi:hypothetical protein
MMPIVTHPWLTSWQEKIQKLIAGKMSSVELTKQRVQERLATQKLDRQDLLGRSVALRDDINITIDMDDIHTVIEIVYVLPTISLTCPELPDQIQLPPQWAC